MMLERLADTIFAQNLGPRNRRLSVNAFLTPRTPKALQELALSKGTDVCISVMFIGCSAQRR